MSNASVVDTRSPYRGTTQRLTAAVSTSQMGSPSLTLFRRSVHALVRSSHLLRDELRRSVIERLRASRDPMGYMNALLEECVTDGGPDGLDIAIDVLTNFPELTLQYAREFRRLDQDRLCKANDIPRHHLNDDVWYVLLRSAGSSGMDGLQKLGMLTYFTLEGPERVREASIHAIGDMGGSSAIRLLRRLRAIETSAMVKETIDQVLDDLEG